MKKLFFLLLLAVSFNIQAQDLAKSFDPEKYSDQLTEKIITVLNISDSNVLEKIQKGSYHYAKSIEKHIILFQQKGLTSGKTLDEVIEMVKPHAMRATRFQEALGDLVGKENLERLKEAKVL